MLKKRLLAVILRIARGTGMFALARRLTRNQLRILCYHGAALEDEHRFSPGLFMTADTFARRMAFLAAEGYPILPLAEAVRRLDDASLPDGATVLTFDDGWYGTYDLHHPILRRHGFPCTVYVATYYVEKNTSVFNVAASYVLWKAGTERLDLGALGVTEPDGTAAAIVDGRGAIFTRLNAHASALTAPGRQDLLRRLCETTGVDWRTIEGRRLAALMTGPEIAELAAAGVDIQLHTHRHHFPHTETYTETDTEQAVREIEDNRRALSAWTASDLKHFCYPSGRYSANSVALLDRMGIRTATTTEPGFNRRETPRLELRRFLDSEAISDLEFEAEMTGFLELIRRTGYRI